MELIESAVFPDLNALDVTSTGDIAVDLRHLLEGYCLLFGAPAARAGVPGLLAAYQAEPGRHLPLAGRIGQDVRPAFRAALAAARPGTVDPKVDPDAVVDMVIGAALYLTFVQPFTGREDSGELVADLLARAVRSGQT